MSKSEEFSQPKSNDVEKRKENIRSKLLKDQKERQLGDILNKFLPMTHERLNWISYQEDEWRNFFNNFAEIITKLLALDSFNDNQELKKECEEVLVLLHNQDIGQSKRYSDLMTKFIDFFVDTKTSGQLPLP